MPANPYPSTASHFRLGAFAGAAALALGVLTTAPAYAHDSLIASTPEADEVLTESPEEVVLEFSGDGLTTGEGIVNEIVVLDSEDQEWSSEDPAEVNESTLSTDIPEPLPNGEYEVHYRVVYSDGHSEELSFGFEVEVSEDEDDGAQDQSQDGGLQDSEETAEPTDPATSEDPEADETPAAGDQQDGEEAVDPEAGEDESGQWAGVFGWGALVVGILALAGAVGYAMRRRSRSQGSAEE